MAPVPTPLRLLHRDATLAVYWRGNLMIAVWHDAPTSDQLRRLEALALDREVDDASALLLVNLVISGTPRFDYDVREQVGRLIKEGRSFRLGTAHVVLVPGLAGVATRAFLSAYLLLSRGAAGPVRLFTEIEPAAKWGASLLDERAPGVWTAAELADTLKQAREAAELGPPRD